ncbi:Exportin-4-like protein [Dinothrombium tinctorium]|uniref:Exportin-4 n=2 Tax=Dinothrombium tinctorium TaxID=1965070 RepID=A0A443RIF8_9ACAR|nr:Exportin-4-like protein [Dinothrombium tinctorium]
MSEAVLQQLETYANLVLAQPNEVSNEQRKEAQQIFLDFQKTKTPFELCRFILETSRVSFVQFQAAACLKNGVIRDWSYLKEKALTLQLLNYLLEFVGKNEHLESYVREHLLLVCAIILKRCGIDEATLTNHRHRLDDDEPEESSPDFVSVNILNSVLSLISSFSSLTLQSFSSPNGTEITYVKAVAACSFILAILNEYSSSTRASDFGLPWIKHLETKKKFENNHLKHIFSSTLQALHNIIQPEISSDLLKMPESINLLQKLIQIIETVLTWNFDFITIISSQYAKHVDGIENPVLQPGIDWVDIFINGNIIQFIFYVYIRMRELSDEKLMHHSLQCLSQLSSLTGCVISNPKNRIQFISHFLNGTLHLLAEGFHKFEAVPLSTMLHRICLHLQSRDTIKLIDKEASLRFVTLMSDLMCRLLVDFLRADEGKDIADESDAEKYKTAIDNLCDAWMVLLQAIEKYERYIDDSPTDEIDGTLVRRQNSNSQDIIDQNVINECARKMFDCFLRCHLTQPEGFRSFSSNAFENEIYEFEEEDSVTFNEQLSAIGSFAPTWTLTQSNYGERDLIPQQILQLSIKSSSDSTKTIQALRNCDIGVDDSTVDPKYILENRMQCLMSPQVSRTLSLFVTRFMSGYLLPNENDYSEMSLCLNACFGRDSSSAADTLNFLVDHIIVKLFYWSSETEVTELSAASLVTFVQNSPERGKSLIACPSIKKLFQKHCNNQLQELSMTAHLSETTRNLLIEFCESICGVSSGTTSNNVPWGRGSGYIYMSEVPKLIDVFHNYNDVILSILEFVSTATNKILCFLKPDETLQFYEGTINILNVFAKHNAQKSTVERGSDEEAYSDILLILQILNDLAAKDFIDWYPSATQVNNSASTITATQVVFIGLNIIMPLMSAQILEFPKISQNYYKLIGFLCEDPERLRDVPQNLMESVMGSISHALKSTFPSEIKCNCLSMLSLLGCHCLGDMKKFENIAKMLEPFLKVVLEFTLLDLGFSKDVTLRENVANTMFTLICCYPDVYRNLVEQLIISQVQQSGDPSLEAHLRKSFGSLTTDIPLNLNRVHRTAFKQRFETFVAEIQGVLCVK